MSDLVERLRQMAGDTHRGWGPAYIDKAGQDMAAAAEALEAAQARIEAVRREALDALRPFATYMDGGLDQDNHGAPLPDEQGVGWVYLTQGDFRRAAAAIRALTKAKEDRT